MGRERPITSPGVSQAEIVVLGGFALMVTDGRTYGRTDGRTDRPSYRDARTHLKRNDLKGLNL